MKAHGWSIWLIVPVPAHVLCQDCRGLGSLLRLLLLHYPFMPPPQPATSSPFCPAVAGEGLALFSARSQQGGWRGHPSAHASACKPVSLWQVAKYFAELAWAGHAKN